MHHSRDTGDFSTTLASLRDQATMSTQQPQHQYTLQAAADERYVLGLLPITLQQDEMAQSCT